jgi:hypothetical protein
MQVEASAGFCHYKLAVNKAELERTKKGSRFHGSLIKSIAFPQKLLKNQSFT